ncbi:hypothetical protein HC256_005657 [Beauveria bassiana]|nr:hypothetical protein HC256_005657 [Beauveria bassiana]
MCFPIRCRCFKNKTTDFLFCNFFFEIRQVIDVFAIRDGTLKASTLSAVCNQMLILNHGHWLVAIIQKSGVGREGVAGIANDPDLADVGKLIAPTSSPSASPSSNPGWPSGSLCAP